MTRGPNSNLPGIVYLVGGGPGDPELVTKKGLRLIETADAIFYDALAPTELLSYRRPEANVVYVGKKRTQHAYSQQQISDMMIAEARAGKRVVPTQGRRPLHVRPGRRRGGSVARCRCSVRSRAGCYFGARCGGLQRHSFNPSSPYLGSHVRHWT